MAAEQIINGPPPAVDGVAAAELGSLTRLKFMIVRGFLWGWARCFSLKGLYLFGQAFGLLEWLVNHKRRRKFQENLRQIFGPALERGECPNIRSACLRHFMRLRCDKLLYLIFDKLPREKILRRVKFHNREILDAALARNKGVYVCMSHNGSHHVLILLMALLGYRVAGVRDRNEGALRRYVQERYEETFPEMRGIRMFFADTYPRALYRCFEEGYILGTALDVGRDRGAHLKTATVQMFGEEKRFLTGTMQIALRCGAPILQGFVVSRKNFYFRLIVKEPLVDPDQEADEPAILQQAMQKYADNIAEHVARYPCHISKS
ncbi:MAG: lysophospholipid acyltransferase family protein [Phycisphaerae bacterium]|jgi:lauroyl/myristoyl acyltransferase